MGCHTQIISGLHHYAVNVGMDQVAALILMSTTTNIRQGRRDRLMSVDMIYLPGASMGVSLLNN